MSKLYLALVLGFEALVIGLLSYEAPLWVVLLLAPILPLMLVAAFLLRRFTASPSYRVRRISPEEIVRYRSREPEEGSPEEDSPEDLSRSIIERADEIRRTLLESPSEVQVEMCALGYRACVNDVITLTHLVNEELKTAGPIRRLRLRSVCQRATDSLSGAREAMPPGALRTTRQEHQ
jgi:hypothetical protein